MLYRTHLLLNLALANAAMLPLLALAWIRLGPWEPLAWLSGLLMPGLAHREPMGEREAERARCDDIATPRRT